VGDGQEEYGHEVRRDQELVEVDMIPI
jgi:hypothetical protein